MQQLILRSGCSFRGMLIRADDIWVIFQRMESVPFAQREGDGREVMKVHVSNVDWIREVI